VHPTSGILRHFQAFSTPKQNPALEILSTPAHPQVTQTVGQPKAKNKIVFDSQSWFYVWLRNSNSFLAVAFFKFLFESGFQQAGFQVLVSSLNKFSFYQQSFRFILSSRWNWLQGFWLTLLVNFGFDWLCQFLLAKFTVGFVGSHNRLAFFLKKFWQVEFVKFSRLRWRCCLLVMSGFPKLAFWFVCGFV